MWDLIVSSPDHCLSFYLAALNRPASLLIKVYLLYTKIEI